MIPTFLSILDSRGYPTVKGLLQLEHRTITAAVPSGASTGSHEALELRDGGDLWNGKGVSKAIKHAEKLAKSLHWRTVTLEKADKHILKLETSKNKKQYGANATLAVSMLGAATEAAIAREELFVTLGKHAATQPRLPTPFSNVLNGGRHAGNPLKLQEFMLVPYKATSFSEAVRQVVETTHVLKTLIEARYGKDQTGVGDEGGFAPSIRTAYEACDLLMQAMNAAGHDLALAIDAAASEFFDGQKYHVGPGERYTAAQLTHWYLDLIDHFPIISLEDPFHEDDFESFATLRQRIVDEGFDCMIVGDDLTVTNPERIEFALDKGSCNCLLLKINQIGTVSEAIRAARLALDNGWGVMVSHRSGETTDTFIADLATGLGCGMIKIGAPVRGERTAKYNRLLELEHLGVPYTPLKK